MPVWFFYVDESHDAEKYCLSALMIRHSHWRQCFEDVRAHRTQLKTEHGLFLSKEIHARDLVSGHGRISPDPIGKWQRSRIFFGLLQLIARLPEVKLFNICLPKKGLADPQLTAWDRLVNRIERQMQVLEDREIQKRGEVLAAIQSKVSTDEAEYIERRLRAYKSRAVIIADEGREAEITKAIRRMGRFNYIPSRLGAWEDGQRSKNITAVRLIEDPVFKKSHRSYFIQLADCAAYALLKRESTPSALALRYGLHEMFDQALKAVCHLPACRYDELGIVRR